MITISDPNNGRQPKNENKDLVNDQVRFPQVRLIGPNGEQLGIMSSREAQFKANQFEMDLYCVSPNAEPPVCKIINYSKFRFEQQKKAKDAKKNQKIITTKELRLTPQTGLNDLKTKANQAKKFLAGGDKVKVSVKFKGRQLSHVDVGEETLNKFIELLEGCANIEKPAAMDGRWLVVILAPIKK